MKTKKLPDIHRAALKYKNRYRLKHDGGRAWIKDSQLHDALHDRNKYLETRENGVDTDPVVPYRIETVDEDEA